LPGFPSIALVPFLYARFTSRDIYKFWAFIEIEKNVAPITGRRNLHRRIIILYKRKIKRKDSSPIFI
jgi:hypothetical protein